MKFLASSSKSLLVIQTLAIIIFMIGLPFIQFSIGYLILSIIAFYCYSVIGISMMLHRYYSHKSFKISNTLKWFFTIFAILAGRGSPLGWVYIHRIHHATSDSERDPHSPHFNSFKFIGFNPKIEEKINYFIIKEFLTPVHIKIDQYYLGIILCFLLCLCLIDINLVFYIWALPVLIVSITQTCFNFFAHKYGYRNFETSDKSTNNIFLWPFILGDAWHNNHHANASKLSTKVRKFEFDPLVFLINLIADNK